MPEQLTGSWKKNFDIRFLAGEDIEKPYTLTIKAVVPEEVFNRKLNKKEPVTALVFAETDKMMVLKPTNARTISKVLGTQKVDLWVGKKIILEQKRVNAFGSDWDVIRVKMQKVQ